MSRKVINVVVGGNKSEDFSYFLLPNPSELEGGLDGVAYALIFNVALEFKIGETIDDALVLPFVSLLSQFNEDVTLSEILDNITPFARGCSVNMAAVYEITENMTVLEYLKNKNLWSIVKEWQITRDKFYNLTLPTE